MWYDDETQKELEPAQKRYEVKDSELSLDIASLFKGSTGINGLQGHSSMDTLARDSQATGSDICSVNQKQEAHLAGDVPGDSYLMAVHLDPLASDLPKPKHSKVRKLSQELPFLHAKDLGVSECLHLAEPTKYQHMALMRCIEAIKQDLQPIGGVLQAFEVSSGIDKLFDESVQEGDIMLPVARVSSIPSIGQFSQDSLGFHANTISFVQNALPATASIHDFPGTAFISLLPPNANAIFLSQIFTAHGRKGPDKIISAGQASDLLLDPSSSIEMFVKSSKDYLEVLLSFQNCLQTLLLQLIQASAPVLQTLLLQLIQASAPVLLLYALSMIFKAGIG